MITHDIDETRSDDLRWSLCGVLLYDEKQLPHGDEPATCRKMPAIQVGDQLPETPRREEDCEEYLTGRRKPLRTCSCRGRVRSAALTAASRRSCTSRLGAGLGRRAHRRHRGIDLVSEPSSKSR